MFELLSKLVAWDNSIAPPPHAPFLPPGLANLGLLLVNPPEPYGYDQTPENSLTFARLGYDGIHFSLLDVAYPSDSTVGMTIPMAGLIDKTCNVVLSKNLYDFLCLGFACGFGPLGNLHIDRNRTIHEIENGSIVGRFKDWPEHEAYIEGLLEQFRTYFDLIPVQNFENLLKQLN